MPQSYPQLCRRPPIAASLPGPAPFSSGSHRSTPSNFFPLIHYFISAPNSNRHFLGAYRPLEAVKQKGQPQIFLSASFLSVQSPSLIPRSEAGHLLRPLLTLCPITRELSRTWWSILLSSLLCPFATTSNSSPFLRVAPNT